MKTPMKSFRGSPLLNSNMLQTFFPTSIPLIRTNLALYLLYDYSCLPFSFRLLRFFGGRHFLATIIHITLIMPPPFPHLLFPPRLPSLLPTLPLPPPGPPFFPSLSFPPLHPHLLPPLPPLPPFSASPSSSFSFPPSSS